MSTRMIVEEVVAPSILNDGAKVSSNEVPQPIQTQPQVQEPYFEVKKKKSCSPIFWIIIPGIFILGAILGGIVFYQRGVSPSQTATIITPTPIAGATASPTVTPEPAIDLTKYTINIFNGSGTPGEAGRVKTLLTTTGFKTGTTANAATYDYTKTVIKAKSTVDSAFISALSATLGKNYVVEETTVTINNASPDNVQVVVGSLKAK